MDEENQKIIEDLAEKVGLNSDDLNKLYKVIEAEQRDLGVPEEKLADRIPRRMRAHLRGKLSKKSANTEEKVGTILWKFRAIDRAKKHIDAAKKFEEKYGRDRAIQNKYMNEKGKYLYVDDKFKKGEEIPAHDYEADAFGLVLEGEKEVLRKMRLKGEAATKPIPLMKPCKMDAYVSKKGTEDELLTVYDEYIDFTEALPLIKEKYPKNVLMTLKDVEAFHIEAQRENTWNPWCIVNGDLTGIHVFEDEDEPDKEMNAWVVNIDDTSLRAESGEDDSLGIFFPDTIEADINISAADCYFIVGPYEHKEKGMRLNGLGYWVDEYDRAKREKITGTPSAQVPWG